MTAVPDVMMVVGLGNPGSTYHGHRHNVGQHVVDVLARGIDGQFTRSAKSKAQVLQGRFGVLPGGAPGPRLILVKPSTFMNVSGPPVRQLLDFHGLQPENLLVIHDELDLAAHQLKLKFGGGEGGHNGLKSISSSLGTRDYSRLRVGIGRPPGRMDPAAYVLSDFPAGEGLEWQVTNEKAAEAVGDILSRGWLRAQETLHANP